MIHIRRSLTVNTWKRNIDRICLAAVLQVWGVPILEGQILFSLVWFSAPSSQNIKQGLTASRIQDLIIEVTSLLVARGAKLKATDEKGRTPIDVARENKFTDLVEIMEKLRGVFTYTYILLCMCSQVHMYAHMYIRTCVRLHIRTLVYTYIHTYVRICTYVHWFGCYFEVIKSSDILDEGI